MVKVWYHVCANRGRGCYNTRLKEEGGCTIWYNEKEVNNNNSSRQTQQQTKQSWMYGGTFLTAFLGTNTNTAELIPLHRRRDVIEGMAGNQKCSYSQITASRSADVYIKPKMFFILGADG